MEIDPVNVTKKEAKEKLEELNKVGENGGEFKEQYRALAKLYEQIAEGKKIVNLRKMFRKAGWNDNFQPKLAIAPLHRTNAGGFVSVTIMNTGHVSFFVWNDPHDMNGVSSFQKIQSSAQLHYFSVDKMPPLPKRVSKGRIREIEEFTAKVPIVPPKYLPKEAFTDYYIVWEVDKWEVPKKDPMLVKQVSQDLYAVIAVWDLTDLEQDLMTIDI